MSGRKRRKERKWCYASKKKHGIGRNEGNKETQRWYYHKKYYVSLEELGVEENIGKKERYTNMIQPQKIYYVSLEPGIEWNEGQRKIQEDNTTAEKK